MYTTQKKFRITYYMYIIVLAILNPCSYIERDGICVTLSQRYRCSYGSTSTHYQ